MRSSFFAAALASFAAAANAISTIEVVGNKFFDKDGKQFFLKGNPRAEPSLQV
jgi:hypothetical protein